MPRFASPGEFAKTLTKEGAAFLASRPSGRYADAGQWLRSLIFLAALGFVYFTLLMRTPDIWSLGLAALAGFLAYTVVASFCHDASHMSLSRSRHINRFILFLGFAIVGVSGALWSRRHIRTHHMFPNVDGTDIDADSTALIRLTPHRPWRPWHRLQPFYAPLLYTLVLAHLAFFEDFIHFRRARHEAPQRFRTWLAAAELGATKLIHIGMAIVLPLLVVEAAVWQVLIGYALASAAASAMFVMINVGTHVCDEAEFVRPAADGTITHDWATHQALTAVDWAPTSSLAVAVTGGANAHAAHHIFTNAAHCHNAGLSRIVADCARRFGRPHHVVSFTGMLASHFRHLNRLAKPDPAQT